MVDSEHLTYRDCSEYICLSYGDESQSRCKITGVLCVADEAGEQCSMWEEEKAEILREEPCRECYDPCCMCHVDVEENDNENSRFLR